MTGCHRQNRERIVHASWRWQQVEEYKPGTVTDIVQGPVGHSTSETLLGSNHFPFLLSKNDHLSMKQTTPMLCPWFPVYPPFASVKSCGLSNQMQHSGRVVWVLLHHLYLCCIEYHSESWEARSQQNGIVLLVMVRDEPWPGIVLVEWTSWSAFSQWSAQMTAGSVQAAFTAHPSLESCCSVILSPAVTFHWRPSLVGAPASSVTKISIVTFLTTTLQVALYFWPVWSVEIWGQ